jgi:hypothetical protein
MFIQRTAHQPLPIPHGRHREDTALIHPMI